MDPWGNSLPIDKYRKTVGEPKAGDPNYYVGNSIIITPIHLNESAYSVPTPGFLFPSLPI